MKMLVIGDLSYYGDFEVGNIYDIKMGRYFLDEGTQEYMNEDYESYLEEPGVVFIDAGKHGDEYIELEHVQTRVIIFKNDKELAHYLIDNKEGFAENIVRTSMIFQ
jgi:hypothetical protein